MEEIKMTMTVKLSGRKIFQKEKGELEDKEATQVINMTKDAYEFFTSKEHTYNTPKKKWLQLSKKKRIEAHLDDICKFLGGSSYTYHIYEN